MSINKLLCVTLGALLGSSSESDNNSIIDEKIQYVITSSSEEASNNNEEESEAHRNAREYLSNLFNKKSHEHDINKESDEDMYTQYKIDDILHANNNYSNNISKEDANNNEKDLNEIKIYMGNGETQKPKYKLLKQGLYYGGTQIPIIFGTVWGARHMYNDLHESQRLAAIPAAFVWWIGSTTISYICKDVFGKWCSNKVCKCINK